MPKSLEQGFDILLKKLTPLKTETDAARRHRASIEKCLTKHFGMTSFFRSGSFGNGTSIRKFSDVDYFAVIPRDKLSSDSRLILKRIKYRLNNRFQTTNIIIKSPTVYIPFGILKCETTEIVPADLIGYNDDDFEIYDIPSSEGSWIKSSPKAHNKFVAVVDDHLNSKVRPLIRFIKFWKYQRQVPISSFYLELYITKYCFNESSIVYSIDIENILKSLFSENLSSIKDPMQISGLITPCFSEISKKRTMQKIKLSIPIVEKANKSDHLGKARLAFYYWRKFFNGQLFPTY